VTQPRDVRLISEMPPRRFPPPWTAEETDACFIVKDHAGLPLAYVGYLFNEPPTETARSNSC
jgi:hypothetical protein